MYAYNLNCFSLTDFLKAWLKQHDACASEIPVYVSHLRDLFHQSSKEKYTTRMEELRKDWSQPFTDYYMTFIHPEVPLLVMVHY